MLRRILIPLRTCDRVEKIVSYVSGLAEIGTKVTFVMHYPVATFEKFNGQFADMITENDSVVVMPLNHPDETINRFNSKKGETMLAEKILIPIRRHDRIEEFLPCIERITRPGTKITFLTPSTISGFKKLTDHLLTIYTGIEPNVFSGGNQTASREAHPCSAERQVFKACEKLQSRGVQIDVAVYDGPVSRAVKKYMRGEKEILIMMRPEHNKRLADILWKLVPVARYFRSWDSPAMKLLHAVRKHG